MVGGVLLLPSGDISQCLDTLIVTTVVRKDRDAAKHLIMYKNVNRDAIEEP